MRRTPPTVERPEGLVYEPDFVSEDEERELLTVIQGIDFREFTMRGQTARRTVRHYGYDYDYESWGSLTAAEPLPVGLVWLRDRCAQLAGLRAEELAQALVTCYPPGATIGWHRDAPMFGPEVVGVSLLSGCRMRFQRRVGQERRLFELELAPRSAYMLAGQARSAWQHSVPPLKSLRYSITFRSVRNPSRWLAAEGAPAEDGG